MPDQPTIAVFADTPAQRYYLGAIVQLAGFGVANDPQKASFGLAVSAVPEDLKSLPCLTLGQDLSSPAKAAFVIEALQKMGRDRAAMPARLLIGEHYLDTRENLFFSHGKNAIRLTEKETAILTFLKEMDGAAVSRDQLLTRVWAYADGVETHTLETHIYRLRQKIEKDPSNPEILLTQGDGYSLIV
jgi:hypothetical protein